MTRATELDGLAEHIDALPHHAEHESIIHNELFDSMIEVYILEQARVAARAQMYLDAQLSTEITHEIRGGIDAKADEDGWAAAHKEYIRAMRYFTAVKVALGQ